MGATSVLWERLVDDAAMFPPGNAPVADAVAAHRQHREAWYGFLIGPLVVSDQRLAEVGRSAASEPVAVSVVNSSGAGGLVALAGRTVDSVPVVSVESALRDLDDLAGNAARVVAAAEMLAEDVAVFVEIPYAAGWERAVAVVEEAGRYAKLRTGGGPTGAPSADQLARQLSVLIEADLPFKVTAGVPHADAQTGAADAPTGTGGSRLDQHGILNLLVAVHALVDGASLDDAAAVLRESDGRVLTDRIGGWSEADATRVRRRLRSFGCCGALNQVGDLVALGLLAAP